MTGPADGVRQFAMSAFSAVTGLRRYMLDHPECSVEEAARALRRSDADYAAADFDAGISLHSQLPPEIDFSSPVAGIRAGLTVLIRTYRPWWCRFFPYGRQRLATALTVDEMQTFRAGGLFEDPPSLDVVAWWDSFAAEMRSIKDEQRSAQGRYAEVLSLEYERSRMISLNIAAQPQWTAIEDNSAGYDIQSFDPTPFGLKNRLIEVKSSQYDPPQIILTRGEWEAAVKYGEAYVFHIWQLPEETLLIKSVADISTHIPQDGGDGTWKEVRIQV